MEKLGFISKVLQGSGRFLKKHAPEILVGSGLLLMGGALISMGVMSPKAKEALRKKSEENGGKPLTFKDKFGTVWKFYILPVGLYAVATTSIVCGIGVKDKRAAALAAACEFSQSALLDYRNTAKEILGEKKEEEIKEAADIATAKRESAKAEKVDAYQAIGDPLAWFIDPKSKRKFYSTVPRVRRAESEVNCALENEWQVSLNEFFDRLGIGACELGDYFVFTKQKCPCRVTLLMQEIDGEPMFVMSYDVVERERFY